MGMSSFLVRTATRPGHTTRLNVSNFQKKIHLMAITLAAFQVAFVTGLKMHAVTAKIMAFEEGDKCQFFGGKYTGYKHYEGIYSSESGAFELTKVSDDGKNWQERSGFRCLNGNRVTEKLALRFSHQENSRSHKFERTKQELDKSMYLCVLNPTPWNNMPGTLPSHSPNVRAKVREAIRSSENVLHPGSVGTYHKVDGAWVQK